MYKKIVIGLVLLAALSIADIDASYASTPARPGPFIKQVPVFSSPYTKKGYAREYDLAERIRSFVKDETMSAENYDIWLDEFKKHVVQCDNLDTTMTCINESGNTYSLQQFIDYGLDSMRRVRSLGDGGALRTKKIQQAWALARFRWHTLDHAATEATLYTIIDECKYVADDALFEGRCAYIAHHAQEIRINVRKELGPVRCLEACLNLVQGSVIQQERVNKIKRAIALGQLKLRGVNVLEADRDELAAAEPFATWERQTAYLDKNASAIDFDADVNERDSSSKGFQLPFKLTTRLKNIFYISFGAAALAAIAGAVLYNQANGKKREMIVRR